MELIVVQHYNMPFTLVSWGYIASCQGDSELYSKFNYNNVAVVGRRAVSVWVGLSIAVVVFMFYWTQASSAKLASGS